MPRRLPQPSTEQCCCTGAASLDQHCRSSSLLQMYITAWYTCSTAAKTFMTQSWDAPPWQNMSHATQCALSACSNKPSTHAFQHKERQSMWACSMKQLSSNQPIQIHQVCSVCSQGICCHLGNDNSQGASGCIACAARCSTQVILQHHTKHKQAKTSQQVSCTS
jgi:hypothetical protein